MLVSLIPNMPEIYLWSLVLYFYVMLDRMFLNSTTGILY